MDVTDLVHAEALKKPLANGAVQPVRPFFSSSALKAILREPLVLFLLLGGLLFLVFNWRGGNTGSASNRIVITNAQIEHLAVGFARTWQRPPTEAELKELIDDYVKDEIATREALAMGLDRDDVIIRRRLRQKLEFLAEGTIQATPPTDADLKAWMARHPDSFHSDPKIAFRQVYLNPQRHGTAIQGDAAKLLARLKAGGPNRATDKLGDSTQLPSQQGLAPLFDTSRTFGDEFAKELMNAEPGEWVGPLESPYGLHLVLVTEKVPAAQQELSAVRPQVEREVLLERKNKGLQALYDRLLQKYTVKIEQQPIPHNGSAK